MVRWLVDKLLIGRRVDQAINESRGRFVRLSVSRPVGWLVRGVFCSSGAFQRMGVLSVCCVCLLRLRAPLVEPHETVGHGLQAELRSKDDHLHGGQVSHARARHVGPGRRPLRRARQCLVTEKAFLSWGYGVQGVGHKPSWERVLCVGIPFSRLRVALCLVREFACVLMGVLLSLGRCSEASKRVLRVPSGAAFGRSGQPPPELVHLDVGANACDYRGARCITVFTSREMRLFRLVARPRRRVFM